MKTVIFDLDGTIALIEHRRNLVEKSHSYNHEVWTRECDKHFGRPHAELGDSQRLEYRELMLGKIKAFKPQWDEFYQRCVNDEPNHPVIMTLTALRLVGHKIVILSGRSEVVRPQTEQWLKNNHVEYDMLIMRPDKDYTPDEVLKLQWVRVICQDRDEILCVFDDRDKVVKMWREQGIPCFQVAHGNF